jgi:hypothetical protein
VKPEKPRKNPALKPSRRLVYPPVVLTEEGHVEFLRFMADINNARADEIEEAQRTAQSKSEL